MSWWHKGFQMTSFTSETRRMTWRMQERVGVPVSSFGVPSSKFWAHRAKLTSSKVLSVHPHTGLARGFYIQVKSWVQFSVLLWSCTFRQLGFCFHQSALHWVAARLMCPTIKTGVPNNKDCHLFDTDRGQQIWIREYLTPLHSDSFVASLGWLNKRASKSE